jgi:hypothetical protein
MMTQGLGTCVSSIMLTNSTISCSVKTFNGYSIGAEWIINIACYDGKVSMHLHRYGRRNVFVQLETHYLCSAVDCPKFVL